MSACGHRHAAVPTACTESAGHDGPHYAFPYSWGFEAFLEPVVIDGEYAEIGTSTSEKSHSTEGA